MTHTSAAPLAILPRPRLDDLSKLLAQRRLCVVAAGAGYGKTTLIGRWMDRTPSAIVTCTAAHRDLGYLAAAVANALRGWLPGLELRTTGLESMSGPAAASQLVAAAAPRMQRPILLFFDDVHELEDGEASRFLQALVLEAPEPLRIVLAGRTEPPVRTSRLRGRGQLLELSASDLRFTEQETAAFLAASAPDIVSYAADVHATTGGWPAAVRLTVEALRDGAEDDRLRILERAALPGGTLFSYLADEVVDAEPPMAQEMLRTLATLGPSPDPLIVAICEGGVDLLEGLQRRGLCVAHGRDIIVPPLVSDFLNTSRPLDTTHTEHAIAQAVRWYLEHSEQRRALALAAQSGSVSQCIELALTHGGDIASAGGASTVLAALEVIPPASVTPSLRRLNANVLHMTGHWDQALAIYEELDTGGGRLPADLAWRMGLIHHLRGDTMSATDVYERGDTTSDSSDAAMLLGWWASAAWITSDMAECRALADRSLEMAQRLGEDRALAVAHTVQAMVAAVDGDRHANESHYIAALDHARQADDVLQQVRIHVNRASHHLEEGHYLESIAESDQALTLAELGDIVPFKALALLNRGQALSRLGRLEAADADFAAARTEWERTRSRHVAYALNAFGESRMVRGVRALARSAHEQALTIAEANSDAQALVPALTGLARVVVDEDPAAARKLAQRAIDQGPNLGTTAALLALGRAELALGNTTEAVGAARKAGELARARRDRSGAAESLELEAFITTEDAASLLNEALQIWDDLDEPLGLAKARFALCLLVTRDVEELGELRIVFGRLGARRLAAETAALIDSISEEHSPEVAIETLGGFRVVTRGSVVAPSAWQSKKARDLCKLLVTRRGKPIHREILLESLWPDEPVEKTANRLSVALSTLRSVFDPDRSQPSDRFIAADKTTVALVLDTIDIDIERFIASAKTVLEQADAPEGRLERVEATYRGDFLEEDPYADWAVALREEARGLYLRLARRLSELATAREDYDSAARYHLRVLERDAYDEPAHLGLVSAMLATGRHGEARRLYRVYCERMADLDIDPNPFPSQTFSPR